MYDFDGKLSVFATRTSSADVYALKQNLQCLKYSVNCHQIQIFIDSKFNYYYYNIVK